MTAAKKPVYIVKTPHPKYPINTLIYKSEGRYELPDGRVYNMYDDSYVKTMNPPTVNTPTNWPVYQG